MNNEMKGDITMNANILVFPIWKVSGRFPVSTNYENTQEVLEMQNALSLAVAVGQTAPVFSYPQPQERKPAGELVDARDRFTQKRQPNHHGEARKRMKGFFQSQAAQVEARCRRALEPLRNLWIG
jgi:hypothetical protein